MSTVRRPPLSFPRSAALAVLCKHELAIIAGVNDLQEGTVNWQVANWLKEWGLAEGCHGGALRITIDGEEAAEHDAQVQELLR